ncbi:MAG: hypothetical protein US49_C0006G0094 [candidate division TM6 bacterium GW2011_GWF2_37_49]|nr:MAG: hypothetical protein US49_C0006G0094 [candidate division TM6 bacterium GW2011_GWF2_37_49]
MEQFKKLPVDLSSFSTMINENYLYVDKTKIIYEIISRGRCFFLARPRRFGKSLLVSTLKEIFLGNKDLFKDLWIGKNASYAWDSYPIIHIDFLRVDSSCPEKLEKSLSEKLLEIGLNYDIEISRASSLLDRLDLLVHQLSEKHGKVVILIDEYDYPIIKNMHDTSIAVKNKEILRSFYGCIKGLGDHTRFLFLTGVSKFSKTSIFSGVNNLDDISLDPYVAALMGYTEEEMHAYFPPYIEIIANKRGCSQQTILDEMRTWYNGYRFSKDNVKVFNPFSVLYYLHKQERANYWFESGTPTFLLDLIKKSPHTLENIDHIVASASTLQTFEIETLPLVTLLYQTGYLTIEEYYSEEAMYKLTYPNEEVRRSINSYLIGILLGSEKSGVETAVFQMRRALQEKNIAAFCDTLKVLFANIPYSMHIQKEAYYHSLFQLIGTLLGFDIQSEVLTSVGRIDLLLQTSKHIYIFEFKFGKTVEEAMAQIKDRRYYEKFLNYGKEIFLIGMVFDFKDKKFAMEWTSKPFNAGNL